MSGKIGNRKKTKTNKQTKQKQNGSKLKEGAANYVRNNGKRKKKHFNRHPASKSRGVSL
jgi:hypothetical protein